MHIALTNGELILSLGSIGFQVTGEQFYVVDGYSFRQEDDIDAAWAVCVDCEYNSDDSDVERGTILYFNNDALTMVSGYAGCEVALSLSESKELRHLFLEFLGTLPKPTTSERQLVKLKGSLGTLSATVYTVSC